MKRKPLSKTVVITGAAGDLGTEIALIYGENGYHIAAIDIAKPALDDLGKKLEEAGVSYNGYVADITSATAVEKITTQIEQQCPAVETLVNNAGVTHFSKALDTSIESYERIMKINWLGAVIVTKEFLPGIIANSGRIVAVSSVAGFAPLMERTGYAASKHAIHGFFDSLREEIVAEGASVTIVCPTFIVASSEKAGDNMDDGLARPGSDNDKTTGVSVTPGEVAKALFETAKKRQSMVTVGRTSKAAYLLRRVSPEIYAAVMRRRFY